MNRQLQNLLFVVLAGLWGFGVYFVHAQGRLQALDRAESTITDFRTVLRGTRKAPDLVTIVEIDDAVVKQLGGYPLPRQDLARLLAAIGALKPKVIAVDILLLDKGSAAGDAALAESLSASPTVIAAAAVFPESSQSISATSEAPLATLPRAERFLLPLKEFADHAQVGIINVATDDSGSPRSIPMLFRTANGVGMSLPLRVAVLATGQEPTLEPGRLMLGRLSIPTDANYALPITFYGPRRTIRTLSASALLAGDVAPAMIRDRVVVLGATVTGGGDFFPTPFERLMPGVEVVATAITHLLAGDGALRDRSVQIANAAVCVVLPAVLVGLLAWRRSTAGLIAAASIVLIWMGAMSLASWSGVWLSAALPIAAAAPPAILFGAIQLWSGQRRAQYFALKSQLFEEFQAPEIQQWLTADPDFLLKPVRQNAAILFIDLSGFTSLSEKLAPDQTRELLKDFHALIDREVASHRGTITSFMGDGAMVVFGLPKSTDDDAARAADCAIGLSVSTARWLTSLPQLVEPTLGYKIGANFGIIIASRLGGKSHHHITATGDTVNVASRLMEVAASHGVELAVTGELLRAAGNDCVLFTSGVITGPYETEIRGRSRSLAVWLWHAEAPSAGTFIA